MNSFNEGLLTNTIVWLASFLLAMFYGPQKARQDANRFGRWVVRYLAPFRTRRGRRGDLTPENLDRLITVAPASLTLTGHAPTITQGAALTGNAWGRASAGAELSTTPLPLRFAAHPQFVSNKWGQFDHAQEESARASMRSLSGHNAAFFTHTSGSPLG